MENDHPTVLQVKIEVYTYNVVNSIEYLAHPHITLQLPSNWCVLGETERMIYVGRIADAAKAAALSTARTACPEPRTTA